MAVCSKLGIFLGKKRYYLALRLGPYNDPNSLEKNPWEQGFRDSSPGLATSISEIGYALLSSRDMAAIL